MGGGAKGEAKEDKLDKAVDFFQEKVRSLWLAHASHDLIWLPAGLESW